MNRRSTTLIALPASLAIAVSLAACGGSTSSTAPAAATAASAPMTDAPMTDKPMTDAPETMAPDTMAPAMAKPFGAACSAVPATGAGSFGGMATDPVATAASNNPVLSTLVTAVKEAGLVDSLNSAKDITVFAPTNDAFKALPKATMDAAMKDPKGLLSTVLTYHVVAGRLSPADLAGTHKTLQGGTLEVKGSGTEFTVNGKSMVVCGNVTTANATVYIVDEVLLPKS